MHTTGLRMRITINSIMSKSDFLENFNIHPAASIFIKIIDRNKLEDLCDTYKNAFIPFNVLSAIINKLNHTFNQNGYKIEAKKRLFSVNKNLKSATAHALSMIDKGSVHVIRFCLGFNCRLDDNYDNEFEKELAKKYKTKSEIRDYRLTEIRNGRDAIFRFGAKHPVMKYITGYIWKMDYCSSRGHYIHLFLFLNPGWDEYFNITEIIGEMWRGKVRNGDVFLYGGGEGRRSIKIKSESSHKKIINDIEDLFIQDALAYVDTTLSNNKKICTFGKGILNSKEIPQMQQDQAKLATCKRIITEIKTTLAQEGIDLTELIDYYSTATSATKARRDPRPPKYRYVYNGQERTWTGQGRMPKYLVQQLKKGYQLDDFLI